MNQLSLANGFERSTKRTRRQVFLEEMLAVVPWDALVARIAPFAPAGTTGRPPYPVLVLLRVHFLQQWFSLADEAVEDALHDFHVYRAIAGIDPPARPASRMPPPSCASATSSSATTWPWPSSRRSTHCLRRVA